MTIKIYPQTIGVHQVNNEEQLGSECMNVNGDWDYALTLLVAGAIGGNITVAGLDLFEDAPQKRIFEALQDAGATLSIRSNFVRAKIYPQTIGVHQVNNEEQLGSECMNVNGDWDYALTLLVAGAIGGNITVAGLDLFEDAPQKRIFEALQDAGATLSIRSNFVRAK